MYKSLTVFLYSLAMLFFGQLSAAGQQSGVQVSAQVSESGINCMNSEKDLNSSFQDLKQEDKEAKIEKDARRDQLSDEVNDVQDEIYELQQKARELKEDYTDTISDLQSDFQDAQKDLQEQIIESKNDTDSQMKDELEKMTTAQKQITELSFALQEVTFKKQDEISAANQSCYDFALTKATELRKEKVQLYKTGNLVLKKNFLKTNTSLIKEDSFDRFVNKEYQKCKATDRYKKIIFNAERNAKLSKQRIDTAIKEFETIVKNGPFNSAQIQQKGNEKLATLQAAMAQAANNFQQQSAAKTSTFNEAMASLNMKLVGLQEKLQTKKTALNNATKLKEKTGRNKTSSTLSENSLVKNAATGVFYACKCNCPEGRKNYGGQCGKITRYIEELKNLKCESDNRTTYNINFPNNGPAKQPASVNKNTTGQARGRR